MLVEKEEDAKKLWCPFSSVYVHGQPHGVHANRNLTPEYEVSTKCLGTGCMAYISYYDGNGACGMVKIMQK